MFIARKSLAASLQSLRGRKIKFLLPPWFGGLGRIGLNPSVSTYEQQGISLWLQLQKELSPDYEVLYFSQKLRKVISHPSELMAAA